MNFIINIPGLEEATVTRVEERHNVVCLFVEMERKVHRCPSCDQRTRRVHDYRMQKIDHLKWFERKTQIFYKRRRYACRCGKRFSEKNRIVERYQRTSVEWNQAISIRAIKGKTFKETAEIYGTSSTTIVRRFDRMAAEIRPVEQLPSVIAVDEHKGDTKEGKYQLIIADGITKKPLDILPNRHKKTIKCYLQKHGSQVQVVIMDMSPAFKAAVQSALGRPVIVADRFHFYRYIYWALDGVRRRAQQVFHDYDRKKCKRMKHVFHKANGRLTEEERWHLDRYLEMSEELKAAYELKEAYREWFLEAKEIGKDQIATVKDGLNRFYDLVVDAGIPEMMKAIQTFQNWQTEILNSFVYDYSNGFLEGINNSTKVIKRNAFGFRNFERFRAKILLTHQYKGIGVHIG
ncbi:ISL3 family transposase [Bacillus sp. T33-2]|uniref:ISL3 family transposase n=1 Tax=Bacillus sp. T33-2 TaxID=2054168 RepID=UPI000C791D67|nr:ISL3 family transposase [Bacillus sp. T33-2]PLR90795.1 ISL3 family transposase [Bacillus sp. T33-2]